MIYAKEFLNRLRSLFRGKALERELDDEVASHIEFAVSDYIKQGLSPEEARRQALARFGGLSQAKEQQREARGLPWLDVLQQDIRYTLRTLKRDKAFTIVAVGILALGIGAYISVFSVVNAILLRPLPFRDPQQLVWFASNKGKGGLSEQTYTVAAFEEFRRHNQSFEDVTSYQTFFNSIQYKLTGHGDPKPVVGIQVAENFFPLLGVKPSLGRLFTPDECQKGGRPAALLSESFWKWQFGADPNIVGKAITLNNAPVTVVGVIPSSFDFGAVFSPGMNVDFYVPAVMDFWRTWGNTLAIVGRLRPGVTIAQAQSETDVLFPQLKAANRDWWSDYPSTLSSLRDHVSGKLRHSLTVLWCAVALILLIVCVNLSNLLMARTASRSKEFAMRTALGASRARLFRQLLTESLLISITAAILGIGFAMAVIYYIAHQSSIALPLLSQLNLDLAALTWAAFITIVAGMLFALASAFRVSSEKLQDSLKDSGTGMSQGRSHERLRGVLVTSEVALACLLLVGAGLLLRSFLHILDVDLGFEPDHVAALKIDYEDNDDRERRGVILQEILRQVSAIPGVDAAALTDMLPLDRNRSWALEAKGKPRAEDDNAAAFVYVVAPGYFKTMDMPLLSGRDFSWQDKASDQRVIIINQAAARREWPGQDPLGQLAYGQGKGESRVIGVVGDVRESSLEETASPTIYLTATQADPEGAELIVRTRLSLRVLGPSVMRTLRALNPGQPATEFRTLQGIVDHAVSPRRFVTSLVSVFAVLGLLLASLGIYGVISYSVTRRTREIGIRMALGASRARVRYAVIANTLKLTLGGMAVGALGSLLAARWISSLLYGTEPTDKLTFVAVILLLGVVSLVAGYIPAHRASLIDPIVAIRTE